MKRLFTSASLMLAATPALAGGFDLDSLQNLTQQQFNELAQDLGAALSYKPLEPADALGIGGFDVGVVLSATSLTNTADLQAADTQGNIYSVLPVPTLRATLGLPVGNMDFGVMYSRVPGSQINLWGADLKWAILPGGVSTPAVAVRVSATRLDGVPSLGFETIGADLSISKGFLNLTPYGGVGEVWSRTAADSVFSNSTGFALQQVNLAQSKVFIGCGVNLGFSDLTFEADETGNIHTFSAKIGFRF